MKDTDQNHFLQAMRFFYANLDQTITLEDIAAAAGISLASLKRLFQEATNQSAGAFLRRLRMEWAFRSLQNKENSVLEIALSAGFENHSAFARSFKKSFGFSPTFAREKHNIVSEFESVSLEDPEIIEINELIIQSVTCQGSYFEAAPLAWQTLQSHLGMAELGDDFTGCFIGIGHDNPHGGAVAANQVKFSAGVSFLKQDLHIQKQTVAKGFYAKFHYFGKSNNLGLAYHYIYGAWPLHQKIKSLPAFMVFDAFPQAFKEERIAIYVPLEN
ncbi:helix-turn-helix domain-containing protein [Candidatus Berkiella aquae]|uniref:AraC family transcriptional regulator n=1 Tax=Candidatus Berkiella aquae TaxID=295108 RepID=A0A0Q9YNI4_9GAMM|nr:helix-turn-helix domain-containing protein [Candidatus Berkiella aquae]MCS5712452.1 AraC family transcriptional regulator [Candidatus Berkiella aquae]